MSRKTYPDNKNAASSLTDLNKFHSLEAVDRASETQLQVSETWVKNGT